MPPGDQVLSKGMVVPFGTCLPRQGMYSGKIPPKLPSSPRSPRKPPIPWLARSALGDGIQA
ncbi:MAG: hypothetical protein LBP92_07365 [Deltaproteobacteria bacterium]|nr:hypothetical protein [Deltaproteobacteria bacterium]